MREMEKRVMVPPGYHFAPLDEELILHYLGNKLNGLPLPSNMVVVRDLYGVQSPWELFNNDDPWERKITREKNSDKVKVDQSTIYVITELKKAAMTKNGTESKNVSRTAGCGAWQGETREQVIYDGRHKNRKIGSKKMFVFEITDVNYASVNQGHWIMHQLTTTLDGGSKFAICEIKRDFSKRTKIARKTQMQLEEKEKEIESRKRGTVSMEDNNVPQRKKTCYDHEDIVEAQSNPNAMPRLEDVGELCDDHQPCLDSDYPMISADQPQMVQETRGLPPNTAYAGTVRSMEQPMGYFHHTRGVTETSLSSCEYSGEQQNECWPRLDFELNPESGLTSGAQLPTIQENSGFSPPNTALDGTNTASLLEEYLQLLEQPQPLSSQIDSNTTTNSLSIDEVKDILFSPNSGSGDYDMLNPNTWFSTDELVGDQGQQQLMQENEREYCGEFPYDQQPCLELPPNTASLDASATTTTTASSLLVPFQEQQPPVMSYEDDQIEYGDQFLDLDNLGSSNFT